MRPIPTRVHGALDYTVGLFLVAAPWLLRFAEGGAETWSFVAAGAAALIYSPVTDYEWGLVQRLPMPAHLGLDVTSGVVLAASPWLFNFHDGVWIPHVVCGVFEIGAGLLTQTRAGPGGLPLRPA